MIVEIRWKEASPQIYEVEEMWGEGSIFSLGFKNGKTKHIPMCNIWCINLLEETKPEVISGETACENYGDNK